MRLNKFLVFLGIGFEKIANRERIRLDIDKNKSPKKNIFYLFSYKNIIFTYIGFFAIVINLNFLIKYLSSKTNTVTPPFWPISVFYPILPSINAIFLSILSILIFYLFIRFFKQKILYVIIAAICLILISNVLHGTTVGLNTPVLGEETFTIFNNKKIIINNWSGINYTFPNYVNDSGQQVYHSAMKVSDPILHLKSFNTNHKQLLMHERTHPPGYALVIYFLLQITKNSAIISILILIISVALSAIFLNGIISYYWKEKNFSLYLTLLFFLLPSVAIYYCATVDAIVCTLFLGIIYFFIYPQRLISVVGSSILLFLCSSISFIAPFFCIGTIFFISIVKKSLLKKFFLILIILIINCFIVKIALNFDYFLAFKTASAIEYPKGSMLINDPWNYVYTRIEVILELLLFYGPLMIFLTVLGIKEIFKKKIEYLIPFILSAILIVIAIFISMMRTGESARIALFLYPILLLLAGIYIKNNLTISEKKIILYALYLQTIGMQLFACYIW